MAKQNQHYDKAVSRGQTFNVWSGNKHICELVAIEKNNVIYS